MESPSHSNTPGTAIKRRFAFASAQWLIDATAADFRTADFIRDALVPIHINQLMGDGLLVKFWHVLAPPANVPNTAEVLYLAEVQLKAELSPKRGIEVGSALVIQQRADGTCPLGPVGRIVLSMADRLDNEALTSNCRDLPTMLTDKRDS